MHSYRSGSLARALLFALVAQAEGRHNHHDLAARGADPSTCACNIAGATSPAAVTVTATQTVSASVVTVTQPAVTVTQPAVTVTQPAGPNNHDAGSSAVPTQIVYVTTDAGPEPKTVTVTAPAQIVTETRTYYVTGGSTVAASTVVVTATATASPYVTTVVMTQPPKTIYVRGSDTIIPSVVTVTQTPPPWGGPGDHHSGGPGPVITGGPGPHETWGGDGGYPTTSIVAPGDHHCHKNGTCHQHPGSYSVTQIDLPTFCGISTVMETVYNTITRTVYPGGNSTLSMGGTGTAPPVVHTVVPPRLRDARQMKDHYY